MRLRTALATWPRIREWALQKLSLQCIFPIDSNYEKHVINILGIEGLFEAAVGASQRYPRDERRLLLLATFCSCSGGIHSIFLFLIRAAACTASGLFSTNEYIARFLGP